MKTLRDLILPPAPDWDCDRDAYKAWHDAIEIRLTLALGSVIFCVVVAALSI